MAETEHFKNPLPDEGDIDDVPKALAAYANAIEDILWERMSKLLGFNGAADAEPGQLIIVDGTSDPVYKSITGDVAVSTAGVTQIGSNKVLAGNINEGAVTEPKILDKAVTSRKAKLLSGEKIQTAGNTVLSAVAETYTTLPGTTLELLAAEIPIELILHLTASVTFVWNSAGTRDTGQVWLNVNGALQNGRAVGTITPSAAGDGFSACQTWRIPLTAATKYTIKLVGKSSAGTVQSEGSETKYDWFVTAA